MTLTTDSRELPAFLTEFIPILENEEVCIVPEKRQEFERDIQETDRLFFKELYASLANVVNALLPTAMVNGARLRPSGKTFGPRLKNYLGRLSSLLSYNNERVALSLRRISPLSCVRNCG